MNASLVGVAARTVRLWTRAYTYGMPARIRRGRLTEIESDLWECQHDPGRPANAGEMITRLLLGMPHDLWWRLEQRATASAPDVTPAPIVIRVSAFTCSLTLHLFALAGAVWLASAPAEHIRPRARTSDAQAMAGPALLPAAPLGTPVSEWPATLESSPKENAMKKTALLIGSIFAAMPFSVSAQQAAGPAFEAASLRASTSGYRGWRLEPQPGGRLTGTNVPATALIRFAYDLPDFQVSGAPGWLDSARFDIAAKAEGDAPLDQKRLMLRTLLAERFKLTVHTETRELPVYALVLAREDGRLGAQLRRSETDCARTESPADLGIGPSPRDGPPRCGYFGFSPATDLPKGRGGLAFRGMTLAMFAKRLVPIVRRAVSDQTGLTGYFDADFDFVAELPPPPPPPGMPSAFGSDPFVSVFTVLPEQLGLRLDSRRGPVDVLVIDRVEAPVPE